MAATEVRAQISLQGTACARLAWSPAPPAAMAGRLGWPLLPMLGSPRGDLCSGWSSSLGWPSCLRAALQLGLRCTWGSPIWSSLPTPLPLFQGCGAHFMLKGSPYLLQLPLPFTFQQAFPPKSLTLLTLFWCLLPRGPNWQQVSAPARRDVFDILKVILTQNTGP